MLLLFFTASVTPFETAFLAAADESVVKLDLLFFLNRFVDIVFFVDIFIQCRMPFRDEQTGHLILDVRKISSRYFKSWFFLDVISVLPFEFIGLILHTGSLTDLALLRFVRLTRLLKLLRVFRASRKLKRLQVSSGLRYSTLELLKIVIVTLFLIHWLGCGYRLIADLGGPNPTDLGWVHAFSIARSHISNVTLSIDEIYFASIYYSSSVLSLIGPTQDFMSPTNNREFFFTVVMNFIGYFLMLFSMSTVTQIFSLTNEVRRKQDILVDDYLALLDDLKLDKRLKFTIYEHLSDFFVIQSNARQTKMLRDLPAGLHGFIAMDTFLHIISRICWLEVFLDRNSELMQELCMAFEIKTANQNSLLFSGCIDGLYYIEKGVVAIEGTVYLR